MKAIPAAALAADNKLVGIAQNGPIMQKTPSMAMLIATMDGVAELEYAATASASAPANAGTAVCQRRSPDRSECMPAATIAKAAAI